MPEFDLWTALPSLVPAGWGLLLLLFAPAFREDRRWLWFFSVGGMLITLAVPILMLPRLATFGDLRETAGVAGLMMLRVDRLALWLTMLFAFAGLGTVLLLPRHLERLSAHRPEVYPLVFLSVSGMVLMVSSENLVMIFLGLEVLSIPLYVLTGIARDKPLGLEAALKYFLLGAFSSGILVFGIAMVFAGTGRFDLPGISAAVGGSGGTGPFGPLLLLAGVALLLVGFAFKIAAVPFHFWAPDVYQGAPTPVTGFMAVGTKAAAFAVLVRVLHGGFGAPPIFQRWVAVVSILAVLTMVGGNLLALVQRRVKRLLAYSSIAHAGYMLLALLAPAGEGTKNLVFYLFAYAFMAIGAFAVLTLFQEGDDERDALEQFDGLWQRRPALAAAMAVFLLSLTGIPPLGGFTGKYVIFVSAIQSKHVVLAAVMGVSAVIGAAYYLRLLVAMFLNAPHEDAALPLPAPLSTRIVLAVAVLVTVGLGLMPEYLLEHFGRIQSMLAAAL